MTSAQLVEMVVQDGCRIKCDTVEQRRAVLDFFDEQGIKLGANTRRHLDIPAEWDTDREYMHPGYSRVFEHINLSSKPDNYIEYEQVKSVVESTPKTLDDRSDAEFAKDFALLLQ